MILERMTVETIKVGKYSFVITENKFAFADKIISHSFKIGGTYDNCISISYTYNNLTPISAKIVHVSYEPECTTESNLEKSGGTAIMLKTFLRYVVKKVPSVTVFTFEDMSHIDCVEKDLSKPPPRKQNRPLSLAYLSIAYNSCTWYEKYFDTKMTDTDRYTKYQELVQFLTEPGAKVNFVSFLQIAQPPQTQIEYLQKIYDVADTYRSFFNAIPFSDRCEILRPWLKTFIEYYLGDKYSPYGWEINALGPKISTNASFGGKRGKKGRRNTVKQNEIFPFNYKVIMYNEIHPF
jgi:hypothetical protein